MVNQPKLDWDPFLQTPLEISKAYLPVKQVLTYIEAVGLKFSKTENADKLSWIPGFKRLAGSWLKGSSDFRLSLGLETCELFFVDSRVNVVGNISLLEATHNDILLWLEEQIRAFDLDASELEIERYPFTLSRGKVPDFPENLIMLELSKSFGNAYVVLRELRDQFSGSGEILVHPEELYQELLITVKETGSQDTNTTIRLGMALEPKPYFYVKTQPHVDVSKLGSKDWWFEDDWTGSKISLNSILNSSNQYEETLSFFLISIEKLLETLKN